MEPKPTWIQDIAMVDPIAAYGIVSGIPRVPISFNAAGSFSSYALGQIPIQAAIDTTISQRTWISNLTYTLALPNTFTGDIFQTQYMYYLRASTGISVRLTVHSGPRYLVSPQFTPLENFVNVLESAWPSGWPLFKQQSIKVEYMLTNPPASLSPNLPPYNVTMTFNGWQFLDHTVDEISVDVAACKLRDLGFFVPKAVECP